MLKYEPILYIEDNQQDANNILCTLGSLDDKYNFIHYRTTSEAEEYLKNNNSPKPWLILLGFKNDDSNSIEFLDKIKKDVHLRMIPVVIMASSSNQCHVTESFGLGVAGYIMKPQNISELSGALKTIMQYWNLSELPPIGD